MRTFPEQYLHGWISDHRPEILSAIHTCFERWIDKERPGGPTPFTSFPRWAEVIGGVMTACGLGDPCLPHVNHDSLGGDQRTAAMRVLYQLCFQECPNQWIKKNDIYDIISSHQNDDERLAWFGDFQDSKRDSSTRIGKVLSIFRNRWLDGIRLLLDTSCKKSQQWLYRFSKDVQV
jgi:hypothetical protein